MILVNNVRPGADIQPQTSGGAVSIKSEDAGNAGSAGMAEVRDDKQPEKAHGGPW